MPKGSRKGKNGGGGGGRKLPELTGSEKQISWADSVRKQWVNNTKGDTNDLTRLQIEYENVRMGMGQFSNRKMPDYYKLTRAVGEKIKKENPIDKSLEKSVRSEMIKARKEKVKEEKVKVLKKYIKNRREIVLRNMTKASDWIDIR